MLVYFTSDLVIYFAKNKENANISLQLVNNKNEANLIIDDNSFKANKYICLDEYAINTKKIYISKNIYEADLIVFLTNDENLNINNKIFIAKSQLNNNEITAIISDIINYQNE